MPAHNEQHRIDETLRSYRQTCPGDGVSFVIALDDCSDHTLDVVEKHASTDPRVHAVQYPRLGKGGVVSETFRASQAEFVAFVDADGATPPEELLRLVDTCDDLGSDIAIASRYHPASVLPVARGRSRRLFASVFARLVRRMFGLEYFDTQCGAKVIRRDAAKRIVPLLSARDFVFDVDLLTTARDLGYEVAEVPTVWLDKDGSRLSTGRDSLRMAASLALLWLRHRIVPVQLPSAGVVDLPPEPQPAADRETADAETVDRAAADAGVADRAADGDAATPQPERSARVHHAA
jgi:glycosyltransferase involved in cell wall biosynthesis